MDSEQANAAGGMMALVVNCVVLVVGWGVGGFIQGKIFEKAGKPMWIGWVPIYNLITMLEIVGRPIWWVVLFFIPLVNLVVALLLAIDLAKAFGKDLLYGIGLLIPCVGLVLVLMLAFGDARYLGPPNKPA